MRRLHLSALVSGFGLAALLFALLSLVDLLVPRPYDGVVLEADRLGVLSVREVVPGSGADAAGIRPGDRIAGIDRNVLISSEHARKILGAKAIGDEVPYLLRRPSGLEEVTVRLGRRFVGSPIYFFAALLGFAFFAVGLFVRRRQPTLRAAQIYYLVSALFLLFLVCRLRPASYGWVDFLTLEAGGIALLLLPACFLHFFLVFPRPVPLRPADDAPDFRLRRRRWIALLAALYAVPIVVLVASFAFARHAGGHPRLITGAPEASWWVLGVYMLLGLAVLGWNARRLDDARQRRGAALVLVGAIFGLTPFLALAALRPAWLHLEPYAYFLLAPLALVPLTFAVAIVRFGLLDIRVLIRRSLAYSLVTIGLAGAYAVALGLASSFAVGTRFASSAAFPILFALGVLLLLEPLRHRTFQWVNRFVQADRRRLQEAVQELGRAISGQLDPEPVVREVVERLPRMLGLSFAALYLESGGEEDDEGAGVASRAAGPAPLPAELPSLPALHAALAGRDEPVRLCDLPRLARERGAGAGIERFVETLDPLGVEFVAGLRSSRRRIGFVLLSGASGQLTLGTEELQLLGGLFNQAAIALETSRLVGERTRQAEIERDLEIASNVQSQLLPRRLTFGDGWRVAAHCSPARHVGGDFYTELPAGRNGHRAIAFGDVAGKSVAGALVMMAAHEALQSLALSHREPAKLFELANRRLYGYGAKKSFVALGWVAATDEGDGIEYLLAGQPQLLLRRADGGIEELPLPPHRLPLGALLDSRYEPCRVAIEPGDLVLAYSDGVTEAHAPGGDLFGDERLARTLAGAGDEPDEVVRAILDEVAAFTRGAEPYDDITLVAISRSTRRAEGQAAGEVER